MRVISISLLPALLSLYAATAVCLRQDSQYDARELLEARGLDYRRVLDARLFSEYQAREEWDDDLTSREIGDRNDIYGRSIQDVPVTLLVRELENRLDHSESLERRGSKPSGGTRRYQLTKDDTYKYLCSSDCGRYYPTLEGQVGCDNPVHIRREPVGNPSTRFQTDVQLTEPEDIARAKKEEEEGRRKQKKPWTFRKRG